MYFKHFLDLSLGDISIVAYLSEILRNKAEF